MNQLFQPVLLAWGDSRWYWRLFLQDRPQPETPLGAGTLITRALAGLAVAGLPFLLLFRLFWSAQWSLAGFLLPGAIGALAAGMLAAIVRLAWNRRAAALRACLAANRPAPVASPISSLPRFLAGLTLLATVLALATVLVVGFENLRGTFALRAFESQLRARQFPATLQEIIPTPIPPESNLAESRLLKPILDYERVLDGAGSPAESTLRWRDPAGQEEARRRFVIEDAGRNFRAFVQKELRNRRNRVGAGAGAAKRFEVDSQTTEGWIQGNRVDLALWQQYYRSLPDWPKPTAPDTPAREVLFVLSRDEANLRELRSAANERPAAQFPLHYEDGARILLPQLAVLKQYVGFLALHASALLADQQNDQALADALLAFRLSDAVADEPILISLLVRMSLDNLALQPVWEGCLDQRWTEPQLAALQTVLHRRDHVGRLLATLHGERLISGVTFDTLTQPGGYQAIADAMDPGSDNSTLKLILSLTPRGWVRQSQVAHGRHYITLVDRIANARSHAALDSLDQPLLEQKLHGSPVTFLAALLTPAIGHACDRVYRAEGWRALALVGLALERARLADGRYPPSLDLLSPRFLPEIPRDPMTGDPLRYQLEPEGNFRLYSVGLDHHDDGGVRRRPDARGNYDLRAPADLVWR